MTFRFLRQPSTLSAPSAVAKSGNAPGKGVRWQTGGYVCEHERRIVVIEVTALGIC